MNKRGFKWLRIGKQNLMLRITFLNCTKIFKTGKYGNWAISPGSAAEMKLFAKFAWIKSYCYGIPI